MYMIKRVLLGAALVLLLLSLCACGTSLGGTLSSGAIAWSEADWATAELPVCRLNLQRDIER